MGKKWNKKKNYLGRFLIWAVPPRQFVVDVIGKVVLIELYSFEFDHEIFVFFFLFSNNKHYNQKNTINHLPVVLAVESFQMHVWVEKHGVLR